MRAALSLVFVAALAALGFRERDRVQEAVRKVTSRGIRNNNPGNFKISRIPWRNKVPREQNTDGKFEQFPTPLDGIRIIGVDLRSKAGRGLNTVRKIIEVYAPPTENDTEAYIKSVARQTGLNPEAVIDIEANLFGLIDAIMVHENGGHDYPPELIRQAIAAA